MNHDFDVAILGAGSAGYACALRAAQLGLRVVLVDQGLVGGTCLHRGCIPTKAWLHAAEVRRTVAEAGAFGIQASLEGVEMAQLHTYTDGVVGSLYKGLTGLLKARGVTTIAERGTVVPDEGSGPGIRVGDTIHRADAVVVATGASAVTLGLPVDEERIVTSEGALALEALPSTAIIIGGGVIGVEFASMWNGLGVDVTLLEAADRLLPAEEAAHSKILAGELTRQGIDIRLNTAVTAAHRDDDGVTVSLGDDELRADVLLVAAGRRPASTGLGLEEAGVGVVASGHVDVNENLETTARHIFAAGDLVAGPQLAHRGYAHGVFLAERIAQRLGRCDLVTALPKDRDIARVTYSTPQVASVGLTAEEAGSTARTVDYHLTGNGRAQILTTPGQRNRGVVRLVQSADGHIVGVHLVGADVSELIAEGAMLVGWQATPEDVAGIVHPHPSLSESIAEANWALAGRPLHMHA